MNIKVREFTDEDIAAANAIWNKVVDEGVAFPQEETLNEKTGMEFLNLNPLRVSHMMKPQAKLWDCIYYTPTMWADAVTYATQAMPCAMIYGESI